METIETSDIKGDMNTFYEVHLDLRKEFSALGIVAIVHATCFCAIHANKNHRFENDLRITHWLETSGKAI